MKKFLPFLIIVLVSVAIFQSCKHEPDDNIFPNDNTTDTTKPPVTVADTCSPDTVYFVNDILPIITSNCAMSGCHDANSRQDGVQLTDYSSIIKTGEVIAGIPSSSELYEAITETDPDKIMPPPPASLTSEQKNAIRIWILQGAKNNHCENKCDTSNVTFSKNVWPVIATTCKGCHTGAGASGGVRIENYSQLKTLVDNGNLESVLGRNGPKKPMPPGGPLEDCASNQIRIWIADGAKDN